MSKENQTKPEEIVNSEIKCSYGCGNNAKYKLKNGNFCCESNVAKCPAIKQKLKENHVDAKEVYKNLSQNKKDKMNWNKGKTFIPLQEVFTEDSKYNTTFIKRYLAVHKLKEYKCEKCGNTGYWLNQPITLELHHKNGNRHDNRLENLQYLCPNCHSQTSNYRSSNVVKKHYKSNWGSTLIN